jgi:ATP-dependent helicase HrpB
MTQSLPIDAVLPELLEAVSTHHTLILNAEPGAGKTTKVPLALLAHPAFSKKSILMLEPRRLAAKSAALRMAELLGEPVGKTVGYRMRFESKTSQDTRITVVTEGVLLRMLQSDPSLESTGMVIFDEFHERSLDADLGLALVQQSRDFFREEDDPLHVLVMSATLDNDQLIRFLPDAKSLYCEGRTYPVEVRYKPYFSSRRPSLLELTKAVTDTVQQALSDEAGSILVFLPGQGEIRRVEEALQKAALGDAVEVTPLYGDLPFEDQQKAIQPALAGHRKVVLATNIAETSLTIEGIRVVIDAGLQRQALYDPVTGMNRLVTTQASRAACKQRAGRAGRLEAGVCYRLWDESFHQSRGAFTPPEITQADVTPLALQLFRWGCSTVDELDWLDTPNPGRFQQACDLLQQLGALKQNPQTNQLVLTEHGETLAEQPLHPRLAHLVLSAVALNQTKLGCQLAALLQEKDPTPELGVHIESRLDWLASTQEPRALRARIKQSIDRLTRLAPKSPDAPTILVTDTIGALVALAWPDRVAKQIKPGLFRLTNGRQAEVPLSDSLAKCEWIAIAESRQREGQAVDQVLMASPIDEPDVVSLFKDQIETTTHIHWCTRTHKLIAEEQTRFGAHLLGTQKVHNLPKEIITQAVVSYLQEEGLSALRPTDKVQTWLKRAQLISTLHQDQPLNALKQTGLEWPDFSESSLLAELDDWLGPFLANVKTKADLERVDLLSALQSRLTWPQMQAMDQLTPERLTVPSGQSITLDYQDDTPVLSVKLQAMFGQAQTPVIAERVMIKIHLLSPAGRPLQITQDLAHFWQHAYPEVKKEMKGRYPKHPWPDDPMSAEATHLTKARLAAKS